ncbi:MAG: sensor histidine kinase [Chloroflexi bacterium]|nr:sensor histidine kinase [Chloroflexota bacterium]MBV9132393.1 sensor histidine kinase [Chloroflexota bacterium]MBV9893239.1 sensor histidine kinase [Chloroflexota bacterium]
MTEALFSPSTASAQRASRSVHGLNAAWLKLPLFWRLLGVNLVVVLGGALVGTWLTQRLVLSGSFTPLTHAVLVLAALCLSAGLTMLLLRETFRPIHSLREATRRFNAGDHSARASLAPLTDPDVAALVVDVNALWDRLEADAATIREKTDQAERLAAQVIMAQEEERRRVARELHDEAGQALTAVIIGLERGLASMPEVYASDLPIQPRQLISNLRDLAAQTLDEVRKLALELRPSVLDDLGLVAALRQYVRSIEERSGMAAQLTVTGFDDASDARLPPQVETALFRITQEALTNAIRHARAASVQVRLRRNESGVTLEVRDDGIGLGAAPSADGEHLGMFGMRERARLLGGTFVATPVSPRGTLVQVSVPL